mgnify:CR=1 FL=1
MPGVQKRTFSLAEEQAEYIDAKVATGEYASASEVVREGLRALKARDAAIEAWLRDVVAPTYDELKAHPERAIPIDEAFARIRARGRAAQGGALIRRTVSLAEAAEADLTELALWIAATASPDAALAYLAKVKAFIDGFGIASERGTLRSDIRPGLRVIGYRRQLTITFDVTADAVTILRVFSSGEDWAGAFSPEI